VSGVSSGRCGTSLLASAGRINQEQQKRLSPRESNSFRGVKAASRSAQPTGTYLSTAFIRGDSSCPPRRQERGRHTAPHRTAPHTPGGGSVVTRPDDSGIDEGLISGANGNKRHSTEELFGGVAQRQQPPFSKQRSGSKSYPSNTPEKQVVQVCSSHPQRQLGTPA
jgi:hypothetical protein